MSRYNLHKERLKKLEKVQQKLRKEVNTRLTAKQTQELTMLRASVEASMMEKSKEQLEKLADYIRGQAKLERATKADLARLIVIEERLLLLEE